jgi:hypothetical protein
MTSKQFMKAAIRAIEYYLPEKKETNEELAHEFVGQPLRLKRKLESERDIFLMK